MEVELQHFPNGWKRQAASPRLSQRSCVDLKTCLTGECSGDLQTSSRKQMSQLPFPSPAAAHPHHHALALTRVFVSTLAVIREQQCSNSSGDKWQPSRSWSHVCCHSLMSLCFPSSHWWNDGTRLARISFPRKGKMDNINWMEAENAEDYSALKEQHWPSPDRGKKGNGQEELEEAALQGSNAGPWNQEKAVKP